MIKYETFNIKTFDQLKNDNFDQVNFGQTTPCHPRYKSNFFKSGFVTYESIRIHGFAKQIHVFTNLLYEYCILSLESFRLEFQTLETSTPLIDSGCQTRFNNIKLNINI